jgi:RNA polymerase sigma factor (sigma-70 family)
VHPVVTSRANRPRLADTDLRRLFERSRAARWGVDASRFAEAVHASLQKSAPEGTEARELARLAGTLHLEDLALAAACADGNEAAWDHFVLEQRPALYRAADALDPGGGARDVADGIYADLYGLPSRDGTRRSLLAYYHGRSTLSTWLRAVLSQRMVDRARERKRLDPLPEDPALPSPEPAPDPDRSRMIELMQRVLLLAVAALDPRDRLRLGYYYRQQLTLAQAGRLLGEHEATVSRQLARTRRDLRADVTARLKADGLSDGEIAECIAASAADAGPLDLADLFEPTAAGKKPAPDRSS